MAAIFTWQRSAKRKQAYLDGQTHEITSGKSNLAKAALNDLAQ